MSYYNICQDIQYAISKKYKIELTLNEIDNLKIHQRLSENECIFVLIARNRQFFIWIIKKNSYYKTIQKITVKKIKHYNR